MPAEGETVTEMSTKTVSVNEILDTVWGRWTPIAKEIIALKKGEAKCFTPPLTFADQSSLRSSFRYLKYTAHFRSTPVSTYAWIKGPCKGYDDYRKKGKRK
jgi:hypothetical protein